MAQSFVGAGFIVPAAVVVAATGIGALTYFGLGQGDKPKPETMPVLEPATEPAVAVVPDEPVNEDQEQPAALRLPSFDVVSVEADGQAIVAGATEPGDDVQILLDDGMIGRTEAGTDGKFVAFLTIEPSRQQRRMALVAFGSDDQPRRSEQVLFVEPFGFSQETVAQPSPSDLPEVADLVAEVEPAEPEVIASEETQVAEADKPNVTVEVPEEDTIVALVEAPKQVAPSAPLAAPEPAQARPSVDTDDAAAAENVVAGRENPAEAADLAQEETLSPAPDADEPDPEPQGRERVAEPVVAAIEETDVASEVPSTVAEPAPEQVAPEAEPTVEIAAQDQDTPEPASEAATTLAVVEEDEPSDPKQGAVDIATQEPLARDAAVSIAQSETEAAPSAETVAPQAPAVLLADQDGLRVLQAPEALESIALDTITYTPTGEVSLGGRAPEQGFVRVYLDGQPLTETQVAEDGNWRTALPEVDTGVYTLRIDQLDGLGQVTSRIETPFKREEPAVLAQIDAQRTGPLAQSVLTVQPGATLWAIARDRYGEGQLFVKVFEANRDRIRDPDLIFPGQVFDLPE